ncbi:thermonuclease family protein [Okeania sp. SIO3I5]|uniref:thermonuclease family protein n=1 Tax=Okeania sp. SIO3I5 TaxID=2607805 RepID=UPI0025F92C45|nr:thermonuclease family protein [Okeania sp. SIO3I5]
MFVKNVFFQSLIGVLILLSGCTQLTDILTFKDSHIPETEYWQVESVVDGGRLILKRSSYKRDLQLCGLIDLTSEAKFYLEKQLKQSPQELPTIFASKSKHGFWYGDIWVTFGNEQESITGLLLLNGLARLSGDYQNCPNSDVFNFAENSAKEQKIGIWNSLIDE